MGWEVGVSIPDLPWGLLAMAPSSGTPSNLGNSLWEHFPSWVGGGGEDGERSQLSLRLMDSSSWWPERETETLHGAFLL